MESETGFFSSITEFLSESLAFIVELSLYIPRQVFSLIMGALASVFEAIPALPGIQLFNNAISAVPPGAIWLFGVFELQIGITLILGSYLSRFILRRTPLIG